MFQKFLKILYFLRLLTLLRCFSKNSTKFFKSFIEILNKAQIFIDFIKIFQSFQNIPEIFEKPMYKFDNAIQNLHKFNIIFERQKKNFHSEIIKNAFIINEKFETLMITWPALCPAGSTFWNKTPKSQFPINRISSSFFAPHLLHHW